MNPEKKRSYGGISLLPWLIPVSSVLCWWIIGHSAVIPSYLLPPPSDVARTAWLYIFGVPGQAPYAGRFFNDAVCSLFRVTGGFGGAVILGIPLGMLSGRLDGFQKLMGTSVNALRAVPGICWLPLTVVWFGIGMKTTVFLVGLAAFFPIYLNCAVGARQINPRLLQAGAMMGIGRLRGTFDILLPGAMPHIISGLRLGLGISWAYLVLGELTGVPDGLGAVIMDARMSGRIDMIVVGIIIIAVIGRITDQLLKTTLRLCFKSAGRVL